MRVYCLEKGGYQGCTSTILGIISEKQYEAIKDRLKEKWISAKPYELDDYMIFEKIE